MEGFAQVKCEKCEATAGVSISAIRNLQMMEKQLPIGWTAKRSEDGRSVVIFCPNHANPNDRQQ